MKEIINILLQPADAQGFSTGGRVGGCVHARAEAGVGW